MSISNTRPHARKASALLLVISMIVLMVTVATAFMSAMSRQRGTAVLLAARTKAEIGIERAQSRIIKGLLEDYVDTGMDYSMINFGTGAGHPGSSSVLTTSRWYRDNLPVNDPDFDPWTDDGVPLGSGHRDNNNNLVNLHRDIYLPDMIGYSTGDWRRNFYGLAIADGSRARWHNMEFYDDYFQPIVIDDALPESDKADLRRTARYVLRYATQIMDLNAQICANNNYPGAPILPDGPNHTEYNKFQNYLRHFGRSIKSMTTMLQNDSYCYQFRSDDDGRSLTRDPLDYEETGIGADGVQPVWENNVNNWNQHYILKRDLRLKNERIFRGEAMMWVEDTSVRNSLDNGNETADTLTPHMKGGRILNFAQLGRKHIGDDGVIHGYYVAEHFAYTPHGGSMLGAPHGPDHCSVPWKVNFLNAMPVITGSMVGGLSSHIEHGDLRGKRANADLFGPGYPEPFPLGYEEGRDIPLVGETDKNLWNGYDTGYEAATQHELYGGGRFTGGGSIMNSSQLNGEWPFPYANSYWADFYFAFEQAKLYSHRAWNSNQGVSNNVYNINDYYFNFQNPYDNTDNSNPSYIIRAEADPDAMLNQFITEVYRVLGEGYIEAGSPAQSKNYYDHTQPGLLAGGESFVGLGFNWDWRERGVKRCRLSPQTNTRAMEFMLNDVMISLFGKANPHYTVGDMADLDNIAVDFNGDGYAESTVTGWYDVANDERVWSWWWNGLGPYAEPNHDWMEHGTWLRFLEDGTVKRKQGGFWQDLSSSERSELLTINELFLNSSATWSETNPPIKPFSHTGRFFFGKSDMFQAFVRSEVFSIPNRTEMAAVNRTFVYRIDPDKDGSFEDSNVLMQKEFQLKSSY